MGVLAGFFILSFYGVVGGWTFAYIVKSITGSVLNFAFTSPKEAATFFGSFHQEIPGKCFSITRCLWEPASPSSLKGIHGGIEKTCDILMPTLVVYSYFYLMIALPHSRWSNGWRGLLFIHLISARSTPTYGSNCSRTGVLFTQLWGWDA